MRPHDLPPVEDYAHGKRGRYVAGCRCDECRAANAAYYHERKARADAAAAAIAPPTKPRGFVVHFTDKNGRARKRAYRHACPGVDGKGCPRYRHVRCDSIGGLCGDCRSRLVWNGLVDAAPARRHLRKLSRRSVGYKQVADAAGVPISTVASVKRGERRQLRADTARRILEVTADAIADHATVPADRVRKLIRKLQGEGFSKAELARRLGYKVPALRIGARGRVLARTAHKLERFYHQVMT